MPIVRFDQVSKSLPHGFWLRRKPVLHDVTLSVEPGEVYGFLGPNGAGKTTSMKCLLGLLRPDGGSVELFGKPGADPAAREKLGYLPEHPYFYPHLTGRELIEYFGRLFCIPAHERRPRTQKLLQLVGMSAKADVPTRQYSKGMLQRIGLAQALINEPELVVLDEPMSGLDPVGRREIKDIIQGLRERGTTVFFSSHILADAEALCDRVGLLSGGRVIRESSVRGLLEERVQYWETACENVAPEGLSGFTPHTQQSGRMYFRFEDAGELDLWTDAVRAVGGRVALVSPHRMTLEDYFVDLVRNDGVSSEPDQEAAGGSAASGRDEDDLQRRAAGGAR